MKNYKIKLTVQEINSIYKISECKNKQNKLMSVLSYMKKHSTNNALNYSITRLYKMYARYHMTMSLSYFKRLVAQLKPIFLNEKVAEKVAEKKQVQSIENTNLENNSEKPNNIIINKYTNTLFRNSVLNKKQLKTLADDLMFKMGVRDTLVQTLVINKIKNSKVAIQAFGAINYIKTIISEKLVDTTMQYNAEYQNEIEFLNEIGAF